MYDVTIHREINKSVISFSSEQLLSVFYGLIKKYNKLEHLELLHISKMELWEMLGLTRETYNSEKIQELIKRLTAPNVFELQNNIKLSGSIFIIRQEEEKLTIEIPQLYQNYIFSKNDIKNAINSNNIEILSTNLKTKENILLLKQADLLKIKGKYNKRLYTLLMGCKGANGKGIYSAKYEDFKKILCIPKGYPESMINERILQYSFFEGEKELKKRENKELLKVGLEILSIEKKRDEIKISFKYKEEEAEAKEKNKKDIPQSEKEKNKDEYIIQKQKLKEQQEKEREEELKKLKKQEEQEQKELLKYLIKDEMDAVKGKWNNSTPQQVERYKKTGTTFDMFLSGEVIPLTEKLQDRKKRIGYYMEQKKEALKIYSTNKKLKQEYEAEYQELSEKEKKMYNNQKQYVIEKIMKYRKGDAVPKLTEQEKVVLKTIELMSR